MATDIAFSLGRWQFWGAELRWPSRCSSPAFAKADGIGVCSDHGFRKTPEGRAPASHSGNGVLIIKGPGVRKGGNQLSLHGAAYDFAHGGVGVEDVLPTLLYMQGLPISEELDGTIQYRFFERAYLKSHPEFRTASYGEFFHSEPVEFEVPPRDQDEYRERLRSLGYIN